MSRVVWITGAGGFSGVHLARYLRGLSQDLQLVGLGHLGGDREAYDHFQVVDLRDEAALRELAGSRPPDRVVHLAGRMPPAPEEKLWQDNVCATLSLLHSLTAGTKKEMRILSVGSAAEYMPTAGKLTEKHPSGGVTPYGRSKWAQSVLALACGRELSLHVSVARTFNLVGPGLSPRLVAGALGEQFSAASRKTIVLGDLRPVRDFIDIRDAVAAYWRILERGRPGAVYNVSSGRATSIGSLARSFAALSGFKGTFRQSSSLIRRGEIDRACGDNSKLRRLGWTPAISLRRSLSDMLDCVRG